MNYSTRITAATLGIYAGLLCVEHGVFEIFQGNVVTNGPMINAMGPSCQPDAVWHACFPALTLLPNFLTTGILAIIIGLMVLIWAAGFVHRRHGGVILIFLSILMLPVGGGFIPAFIGVIAGKAGTRIHAPLTWWRRRSPSVLKTLPKLWPWTLILLLIWIFANWIFGILFNQLMLNLSFCFFFLFDIAFPLLMIFSSFTRDIVNSDP